MGMIMKRWLKRHAPESYDFACFAFGADSTVNLFGKVVLFPFFVFVIVVWGLMDLLFTKKKATK